MRAQHPFVQQRSALREAEKYSVKLWDVAKNIYNQVSSSLKRIPLGNYLALEINSDFQ